MLRAIFRAIQQGPHLAIFQLAQPRIHDSSNRDLFLQNRLILLPKPHADCIWRPWQATRPHYSIEDLLRDRGKRQRREITLLEIKLGRRNQIVVRNIELSIFLLWHASSVGLDS